MSQVPVNDICSNMKVEAICSNTKPSEDGML